MQAMLGGMRTPVTYTIDEVRHFPAVVDLVTAGLVFGLSRTTAYEMAAADTFPVRVMKVGGGWRVSTALILAELGIDQTPKEVQCAK